MMTEYLHEIIFILLGFGTLCFCIVLYAFVITWLDDRMCKRCRNYKGKAEHGHNERK